MLRIIVAEPNDPTDVARNRAENLIVSFASSARYKHERIPCVFRRQKSI